MNTAEIYLDDTLLGQLDVIADALVKDGYVLIDTALPPGMAEALMTEAHTLEPAVFAEAGTGREQAHQINQKIRKDRILWLSGKTACCRAYLDMMEQLRTGINQRLFMGLFDYECHYASYEPGAYYRTHLDAFEGRRNRVLSTVLYLNPYWSTGDGGELLLYAPDATNLLKAVKPLHNTMVLFLSERFPHEVLPTQAWRYSLTGWFRVNTSTAHVVDPAH